MIILMFPEFLSLDLEGGSVGVLQGRNGDLVGLKVVLLLGLRHDAGGHD